MSSDAQYVERTHIPCSSAAISEGTRGVDCLVLGAGQELEESLGYAE